MRRVLGTVGAAVVVAGVAVVWASGAGAADAPVEVQSSLVEDFAYPGADAVLAEHGLTVFTGDGHVVPVSSGEAGSGSCAPGLIQVETMVEEEPYGAFYCFRTSGTRGFLTLEVPQTFLLRGGSTTVEATAELASGAEESYTVTPNTSVAVDPGVGSAWPQAILVELRFGTW